MIWRLRRFIHRLRYGKPTPGHNALYSAYKLHTLNDEGWPLLGNDDTISVTYVDGEFDAADVVIPTVSAGSTIDGAVLVNQRTGERYDAGQEVTEYKP